MTVFTAYLRPSPAEPWRRLCRFTGCEPAGVEFACLMAGHYMFQKEALLGRFNAALASLVVLPGGRKPYGRAV